MLLSCGLIVIVLGVICFKEPELAWYLWEMDHKIMGQYVEQPRNWQRRVRDAGIVLLFVGIAALALALKLL